MQLTDDHLVCVLRPGSWEAEPYRNLRHALGRLRTGGRSMVIAVSSAAPGDGKTTTSLNLAAALGEPEGARVLVIDADLRRGALTQQLGVDRPANAGLGLTGAVRSEHVSLADVTRSSNRFRFSIVPSGQRPPSPYEVLESPRLGELIAEARRRYTYVLIDTPPFVPFTDCRVLSRWVDGFILVVAAHRTPRKLLEETLSVVEPSKLLGLVFNGDDGPLWGTNRYYQYTALPEHLPVEREYAPEPHVARLTPSGS